MRPSPATSAPGISFPHADSVPADINMVPFRQTRNPRHPPPMLHMCQLRPSYDHATNATLFRYESTFFRYEKCSICSASPYLDRRRQPSNTPTSRHDEIRQAPPWNSLFQYEPATTVERMERLPDTNNVSTDTTGVPLPIWRGTRRPIQTCPRPPLSFSPAP